MGLELLVLKLELANLTSQHLALHFELTVLLLEYKAVFFLKREFP
jgi:hypothetical protein